MPAPSVLRTLENLRFVKGAIAKKDYAPALTHFRIHDGHVLGYNGAIALGSPIDLNISCFPKAVPFIKAIQTCEETIALYLTPAKRLAIKSGPYNAFVECLPNDTEFPQIGPEGNEVSLNGQALLDAFTTLEPFIAEDASKPWARGILLRGQSAFATNNIILVEKWLGTDLPNVNIPAEAVTEITRIGKAPSKIQISEGSITCHFEEGRWLRSQLLTTEWPDISRILDRASETQQVPIPKGLWKALENIRAFVSEQGAVIISQDRISTHGEKGWLEGIGAFMDVPGMPDVPGGGFNLTQLQLLESVIQTMGWSFPQPCIFFGDKLRGAFVGMVII